MRMSRILRIVLFSLGAGSLIQDVPATPPYQEWNRAAYRLSPPGSFLQFGREPVLISDRAGRIYAFWRQDSAQPCCTDGEFSLLRTARFDGVAWTEPIDFQRADNNRFDFLSCYMDSTDTVHAVWVVRTLQTLYYNSLAAENVLRRESWLTTKAIWIDTRELEGLRVLVDRAGRIHLFIRRTRGYFYTRSSDRGVHWTVPVQLDAGRPQTFISGIFQVQLDDGDGLHVVWHHLDEGQNFVGRQIQYVRSTDGGATWSSPVTIDQFDPATDNPLTQSVESPTGLVVVENAVHVVWIGGPPGGPTGVGRKHRISPDRGLTWGPTVTSILNGLWGHQNGDGLVADASGRIHWVGMARNYISPGNLWEGLWGAVWSGGAWTEVQPVVTVLSPGIDSARLASTPDGHLVTAFLGASKGLYATHTTSPYFYFPHYADGDGWSMQIAINNLSANHTTGTLTVYDNQGDLQELPFESGAASRINLELGPHSTTVLRSLGSSNPIRTGYIRVELDQPEISGVAIFQNRNGTEASVLPAPVGRRYALLVEMTESLFTGVAFVRHTLAQPITLKLFDLGGALIESKEYSGGAHTAKFVNELFPDKVSAGFRGLLVLESEALITAVGLRLGAGLLSTIPVVDLDGIEGSGTYLFPHFGDGGGLSMLLAVNNLSTTAASGRLTVLDRGGIPQSLPFESGPASQVSLSLQPNSTSLLRTSGSSSPAKSGFIRVELDRREASGVAIFRYTNGREASVLPSYPGKKFALFVEQSASFYAGIAIARSGEDPVTMSLYDEKGTLVGTREFAFDQGGDFQNARFLGQVFSLPEEFRGLLIMESVGQFTAVGLRFGGSVLSTVPVTRVN